MGPSFLLAFFGKSQTPTETNILYVEMIMKLYNNYYTKIFTFEWSASCLASVGRF
jgi:hypothetical protein